MPELAPPRPARTRELDRSGELHQRLLEQYAPPSLVVNADYEIVHSSARAERYLQRAGGEGSSNLLSLIRPELRGELHTALAQAVQEQRNVAARNLPIRIDDHPKLLTLHVCPTLGPDDPDQGCLLVLFEPGTAPPGEAEPVAQADEPVAGRATMRCGGSLTSCERCASSTRSRPRRCRRRTKR